MKKFFATFFLVIFSSVNAADFVSATRAGMASGLPIPIFYEEPVVRPRDGASHTPVNLEGPVDSSYIVGPGDFFEILLPSGQEGLQVSPEGTLAIQGCGLVYVSGLTLSEAKRKILDKARTRYDPKFTGVHLVQLRRFVVNVRGAVWNPGQVMATGQMRVKGAILLAGNFKQTANKDSVYIYRKGDTIATTENILLHPGDIIEVPHAEWQQTIDINYAGKIITISHIPGRTLKEYLKELGIEVGSSNNSISVLYPQDGFTRWIDIEQIGSFVPEPLNEIGFHIQAPYVYVGGAVALVGKVPYNSSMRMADYIAASGVTIITGDFHRASVLRNGKEVSVDLATGEILPGDFIDIPRKRYEQVKDVVMFSTSVIGVFATIITIISLVK